MSIKTVKLGDIINVLSGFAFKSEFFRDADGFPIIRIRDVVRGYTDTYYAGPYDEQFVVQNGDILIGMDGNFNAAKWQGGPALLNQRVCKVTAKEQLVDDGYLFHYLPIVLKRIEDATPFVTVKHLSAGDLKGETIPLPPLPEQRRIAAILDKADALRTKRREVVAQLDRLTQSIFVEMFGDPVANTKDWTRHPLGNLLSGIDSGWSPVCLERPAEADEWGVLKLGAVTSCMFDHRANKALPPGVEPVAGIEVKPGDLLFSRKNTYELVAACAFVESTRPGLMMSDLIFRLQVRDETKVNKRFLHALFTNSRKRAEVQKLAGGSAGSMPNISKAKLLQMQVELPPIALQDEFAARIKRTNQLKATNQSAAVEADLMFSSLQHRAFRGEL